MVIRVGLIPAIVGALLIWAVPAGAHLWPATAPDLDPDEIEVLLSNLEAAADAAETEDGLPDTGDDPSSVVLAYDLLSATGRADALSPTYERILLTYDALREGDLDETGAWTENADTFSLIEIVRPADAVTVAPFRARLDAWRRRIMQGRR